MKSKISAGLLIIIALLGASANKARYVQSLTAPQPKTTTNNIQTAIVDLNNPSLITSEDVEIGQDSLTTLSNTRPTGLVDDRTTTAANIT